MNKLYSYQLILCIAAAASSSLFGMMPNEEQREKLARAIENHDERTMAQLFNTFSQQGYQLTHNIFPVGSLSNSSENAPRVNAFQYAALNNHKSFEYVIKNAFRSFERERLQVYLQDLHNVWGVTPADIFEAKKILETYKK